MTKPKDYEPFGDAWKREMMKLDKASIINLYAIKAKISLAQDQLIQDQKELIDDMLKPIKNPIPPQS